jgi:hypothetical protein
VSIVTKLQAELQGFSSIFLFATASRPALEPTQPPIEWVPGALSPRVKRPGVRLTIHLHSVPRLRMLEALPPFPYIRLHGVVFN